MKLRSALFGSLIGVVLGAALAPMTARAGGCCGGGFAVPSLIAGDDRAQLAAEVSYGWIASDVTSQGIWRNRDSLESTTTTRLSGAVAAFDRAQFGASLPFISRGRGEESQAGLGDTSLTTGYEILTDWDYSTYRPKLIGFLTANTPTGRSVNEATNPYRLDSRGRGYWAVGAGLLGTKLIRKFDVFASCEAHRSFTKQTGDLEEVPGFGGSFGAGIGYTFRGTRFGVASTTTFEDPIDLRGSIESLGQFSRLTALTASVGRDIETSEGLIGVSASFTDQTLLGAPTNAALSKTAMLLLTKRWAR
ncbi:MAG: hypothetical protein IPJ84_09880 [Bdellovibrionales bacterium]|nr:hypothetical protein [Bdellovibrionales bacterium]